MWWSDPDADIPVLTRRSTDRLSPILAGLGFSLTAGMWTDAAHTVGVATSPAGVFVGWIDVGWISCEEPFSELRDVTHLVDRGTPEVTARDLAIALDEASQARTEHLRDCERCGERYVPGQMYGAACCHSCAVRDGETRG